MGLPNVGGLLRVTLIFYCPQVNVDTLGNIFLVEMYKTKYKKSG